MKKNAAHQEVRPPLAPSLKLNLMTLGLPVGRAGTITERVTSPHKSLYESEKRSTKGGSLKIDGVAKSRRLVPKVPSPPGRGVG